MLNLFMLLKGERNLAVIIGVAVAVAVVVAIVAYCIWRTTSSSGSMAVTSAAAASPRLHAQSPPYVFSKSPMTHTRYAPSRPPYVLNAYRYSRPAASYPYYV